MKQARGVSLHKRLPLLRPLPRPPQLHRQRYSFMLLFPIPPTYPLHLRGFHPVVERVPCGQKGFMIRNSRCAHSCLACNSNVLQSCPNNHARIAVST